MKLFKSDDNECYTNFKHFILRSDKNLFQKRMLVFVGLLFCKISVQSYSW